MTDGLGSVAYEYNQLSQMTSETRHFSDTLASAPLANNSSFKLEYDYALSGQLKSLKDPYGQQFNYAYDKVGRLNSVAGAAAFAGITTYASNPGYNARGTLTALHYGNGTEMAITGFNNKLQATDFEIKKGTTSIIKKQYQFYNDGSLKFSKDLNDAKFDRSYKYDNLGRTVEATAGAAARGQTDEAANIPYRQSYAYNAFGNITTASMEHYAGGQTVSNYSFANNRNTQSTSIYDAEGNQTADEGGEYIFDAVGRMVRNRQHDPDDNTQFLLPTMSYLDGAGQETKRIKNYVENGNNTYGTSYFIRSTVTGKIVSEVNSTGGQFKTFVSANGATIAEQLLGYNRAEYVSFLHQDASGASLRETNETGNRPYAPEEAEYDARGNNVGLYNPYVSYYELPPPNDGVIDFGGGGYGGGGSSAYNGIPGGRQHSVDGMPVSESYFMSIVNSGMVGGAFGLLEMSARMSARLEGWNVKTKWKWTGGAAGVRVLDADDIGSTPELGSIKIISQTITPVYSNGWSFDLSILSFQTKQTQRQQQDGLPRFNPEEIIKNKAREALNDAKNACAKALSDSGLLKQVKNSLTDVNFISVNHHGNAKASKYFDDAKKNETVKDFFSRNLIAFKYTEDEKFALTSPSAILTKNGATTFLAGSRGTPIGFFLHELTHYATGLSDLALAKKLNLTLSKNASEADASKALTTFFNNNCNKK